MPVVITGIVQFQKISIPTPRKVIGNSEGEGCLKSQNGGGGGGAQKKTLQEGGGFKPKNLPWGGYIIVGDHGGLMVSTLDCGSGSSSLGLSTTCMLCFWVRYFILTVSLSYRRINGYQRIVRAT